jgi:hypothetical protein
MDLKDIGREVVYWINLAQDREKLCAFVRMAKILEFSEVRGHS